MEFIIEHGRLVQYIGNSRHVTIPEGIETIDFLAFAHSTVEYVSFPESLKYIDGYAFRGSAIKEVSLPKSIILHIGAHAFEGCRQLKKITLPETILTLGESAFSGCSIEEITIPFGAAVIPKKCFSGCRHLRQVRLPICFNRIEEEAFAHCHRLQQVACYGTAMGLPRRDPTINETAFLGCDPTWTHDDTVVNRLHWRWKRFCS